MTALIVIAKEPVAGRVKTRLSPPFTLAEAALLAGAMIDDTLEAVDSLPATRRILLFDGATPPPAASRYEVMPQVPGTLDVRLAAAFDAVAGPALLIGMDTPQLDARMLHSAFESWPAGIDAWFGPADDGGFWALGLREPRGDLIRGVGMSRCDTGRIQLDRLVGAGLRVGMLPKLTDVDTVDATRRVAPVSRGTRFATLFDSLFDSLGGSSGFVPVPQLRDAVLVGATARSR